MNRLVLLLMLVAFAAEAATTTRQKTIGEAGSPTYDYSTLASAENGEDGNIRADTGSDEIVELIIQGSWTNPDTTAAPFNGWSTDAGNYICITNSTSKHDGKRYGSPATAYRLEIDNASALVLLEDYVRIYGLQVAVTGMLADKNGIIADTVTASNDIRVGYCIVTGTSSANGAALFGIVSTDADTIMSVFNCLVHGGSSQDNVDGRAFYTANAASASFYNCTAWNIYEGYRRVAGTMNTYNCIAQDTSAGNAWTGTVGGDWNCDDINDAQTPGANSVKNYEVTFVSETGGSENLHLDAASTSIIDVTSDQSAGLFADDIDYVTRAGSWCIGADEYVAATGTVVRRPIIVIH